MVKLTRYDDEKLSIVGSDDGSYFKFPNLYNYADIHTLYIYGNVSVIPDISYLKNLRNFECVNCGVSKIEKLPLSIRKIYCDKNNFETINFEYLPNLEILECSNNLLTKLDKLPISLKRIDVSYNPTLKEIPNMSYLKNLKDLQFNNCLVEKIGELPQSLERLICSSNNNINLPDLTYLKNLNTIINYNE